MTYVTVDAAYRQDVPGQRLLVVPEATRWDWLALIALALKMLWIVLRERPDAVVSTGAAPGYFALRWGRLLGARTLWLDSLANAERLSMCGQNISRHADVWLTQWPHLSSPQGPHYAGAVL